MIDCGVIGGGIQGGCNLCCNGRVKTGMATRQSHRRSPGRKRGAEARANSDLTSHISSLGLGSVNAYQKWCREHGLSGALNKLWQDRRAERALVAREAEGAITDVQLTRHLEQLGFRTREAYARWCREQGQSEALKKSDSQRDKELSLMTRLKSEEALNRRRRQSRHPEETIRALFRSGAPPDGFRNPWLEKVAQVYEQTSKRDGDALLRMFLLAASACGDLLSVKPAVPVLGDRPGNTFIEGLGALARQSAHWIREPEAWKTKARNVLQRFGSLARHLLCQYGVPPFMDAAFFEPNPVLAAPYQEWFRHIGMGSNIRTADVPLRLTKRMAHLFLQAPDGFTIPNALRFGQVLGMGGSEPLLRALLETPLGDSFEHEPFWISVIQFFVNHPMLDPDLVGPIVEYIQSQKFAHRENEGADGTVTYEGPPRPNFAMKGRSVEKLIREVDAWHRELARDSRLPRRTWAPSGFEEFEMPLEDDPSLKWSVRELLSSRDLQEEGQAMHHCVGSYGGNCLKGKTSIWTLRVEDAEERTYRVMTIAVSGKRVTQARGKCNARPRGKPQTSGQAGLERRYVELLRRSRLVLREWILQEGLTMSNY